MAQEYEPIQRRTTNYTGVTRIKRTLVLLAIAGCSILTLFYWRQPFIGADVAEVYTRKTIHKDDLYLGSGPKEPKWTWICQNNTCVRLSGTDDLTHQSLATCNMLCYSSQLWPQPTGPTSLASEAVPVAANKFTLSIDASPSGEVSQYLEEAFDLMKVDMVALERTGASKSSEHVNQRSVTVHVSIDDDAYPRLQLDTDESYELTLGADTDNNLAVNITAHSFCGARHAFETLSQLVWMDTVIGSLQILAKASVNDAPKFKYRGLLLDTARNFFPVRDLLRMIDAMGANKLNTLHWHATDSQSFPLALKSAPLLAKYGAYGQLATYSRKDIRTIVHRAKLRGIRVVIEVDGPSHVGSAFGYGPSEGLGDLAYCINKEPWSTYCGEPPCGQLNPQNPHVYKMLRDIYAEIIELTGVRDVFHIGGDEVNTDCWMTYLKRQNAKALWLNFTLTSLDALKSANEGELPELTLLWSSGLTQSPYLEQLDSNKFTIQLWGSSEWPDQIQILNKGYRSIISHVNAWYLDCGLGSWRDDSFGHCPPYRQWPQFYNHRPWKDSTEMWRVEGGEACHWTEKLEPFGLDGALWPRGAALAERLWSDPEHTVNKDVYLRLDTQRTRLQEKGIGVMPLWGHWCSQNPSECLG